MTQNKTNLLVVDDDQVDINKVCKCLNQDDYDITTVSNGEEAWKILSADTRKFSAILLDRNIPGMNGMDVLRAIKRHEDLQLLP